MKSSLILLMGFALLTPITVWGQTAALQVPAAAIQAPAAAIQAPATVAPTKLTPAKQATPTASAIEAPPAPGGTGEAAKAADGAAKTTAADAAAAAAKQQAEAAETQAKQQRLQKIKKLKFDRRPSAILKAWATPLEDPKKATEEKKADAKGEGKAAAPVAAPASAYSPVTPARVATIVRSTSGATLVLPAGAVPSVALSGGPLPPGMIAPTDPSAAPPTAATSAPNLAAFDAELKRFQRDVTLGNWDNVAHYMVDLGEDESKALYQQLLRGLRTTPSGATALPANVPPELRAQLQQLQNQRAQQQGRIPEKNVVSFEDLMALVEAAPHELADPDVIALGGILQLALSGGGAIQDFVVMLDETLARPEHEAPLTKRQAAKLMFAIGKSVLAGDYLPDTKEAAEKKDHEALNLLSDYFLAVHAKEKKGEFLEKAWDVTQVVLASDEIEKESKEKALRRAVELAPKIRDELGETWLEESFTGAPERGMEIIASIGGSAASALQTHAADPSYRLKGLQLQSTAVEALLKASPERAAQWKRTLHLLAGNWLREAEAAYRYDTATTRGPRLQRDRFGNFFYFDQARMMGRTSNSRIRNINIDDLLEIRPGEKWMEAVDENLRPYFNKTLAQLYLKVTEEDNAFPYIEEMAKTHPEMAENLVEEFLRIWTQNHDPNSNRNRTNVYMYMYGYERKAESIPLTRSKQQRNLEELAELVKRLRALPLEELNEAQLARAFTTCHSSAEVYRLEAIEKVFGSLDALEAKTLAELAQRMRANLLGVWRAPAVQKDKKTKRKQKDIQAEVLRGYEVARSVIEGGLKRHGEDWALQLAMASLEHDENNYRREILPDSKFTERRHDAFSGFEKAAELYAAKVGELREDEESTKVYEIWYYASLGACDLQQVTNETPGDARQPAKIREAILALDGDRADRHIAMFANTLFTRMSAAKPQIKYGYLKGGFEVVGDHKQAREARKVFDYYKDLVTEIKLETVIDGSDVVGHDKPFGVFVNLRHTREIERESGGFGRYLQNQNSNTRYSYNYGRPTADYRDKFEEIVHQSLDEHFDVLSVTFQSEDVNSKALPEYGWRVTPYAYVLLKARGPEVDTLPSLRLDLDFLDTSGYAVIPVESATLPVDASPKQGEPRPLKNVTLTQTLDERQSDEGKLIVEVKASGQGLIPDLTDIVSIAEGDFETVESEDQGLSVSQFDPEADDTVIVSERTWLVTMNAKEGLEETPKEFKFAEPKLEVTEATYQRYVDADLAEVDPVVSLEQAYGEPNRNWIWITAAGVGAGVFLLIGLVVLAGRPAPEKQSSRFELPENLTPFTVIGLLRQIEQNNGLSEKGRAELEDSISHLEQHFFVDTSEEDPDLREIAETWVRKAR